MTENKPEHCEYCGTHRLDKCKNKPYKKNYLTPLYFEWVCRKHYYLCAFGITSKYWSKDKQ